MNFERLHELILEYFVDNVKAYYIDVFGNITLVEADCHMDQIIEDYDLDESSLADNGILPTDDGYSNDDWGEFVSEFMVDSQIFAIVHDLTEKIVYVRAAGQHSMNDDQREALIDFCIKKRSELKYDYKYR